MWQLSSDLWSRQQAPRLEPIGSKFAKNARFSTADAKVSCVAAIQARLRPSGGSWARLHRAHRHPKLHEASAPPRSQSCLSRVTACNRWLE